MFIDFGVKKSQYLRDILGLDNPESLCSFYSFCYVSESFLVSVTWRYSPVCFRAQLCTLKLFLCRIFYPAFIMFGMTSDFASLLYPLKVKVKSLSHVQLFATLDCNPPSSSVHGSLQARILEWFAMTSSRGSSRPMDWTHVSMSPALAGGVFTTSTSWEVLAIVQDKIKSYKNKIIPKTAVANRRTKGGL